MKKNDNLIQDVLNSDFIIVMDENKFQINNIDNNNMIYKFENINKINILLPLDATIKHKFCSIYVQPKNYKNFTFIKSFKLQISQSSLSSSNESDITTKKIGIKSEAIK